jgi:hypothetical protein
MGLLDFLKDKKSDNRSNTNAMSQAASPQIDYTVLPQIADLLSNGDADTIKEIHKLANDYASFYHDHQEWCDELLWGDDLDDINELHTRTLLFFAYWMVGHETDKSFGAYIDWKEETEEILACLKVANEALGYPLDLDSIIFSGNEQPEEALIAIDRYFREQGYVLVCLDTDSDSYHLFIISEDKYPLLLSLAQTVGFKFFTFPQSN